jgi:hypothetical protein
MKALKMALIACSLSAATAVAHAQTPAPTADAQQSAQTQQQRASDAVQEGRVATPAKKGEDCVGPVSFCNLFFGS